MAARKHLSHPEIVRQRIRTSQLVNRLTDHVDGKVELSATQVSAALGLIRKTMPDLSAVAHSGMIESTKPEELSDERLAHIAGGGSAGITEAPSGEAEPLKFH